MANGHYFQALERKLAGVRSRSSALVLVCANLIPLVGVFFFGWSTFSVLFLFGFETLLIGVFTLLKLLVLEPKKMALWFAKLVVLPFFIFHFGIFTYVHGTFVLAFFSPNTLHGVGSLTPSVVWDCLVNEHLLFNVALLIASRGYSFVRNFLLGQEYLVAPINEVIKQPYRRIFLMHAVIMGTGFLIVRTGTSMVGLPLLILCKLMFDLIGHMSERERWAPTE